MKIKTLLIVVLFISMLGTTVLATTGKITNAPSGLIFRKAASKSGEVITTLSNGTEVEIIEKSGDWYKVKYNNQEGYLYAEFVKPNEEVKEATSETTDENTTKTLNSEIKVHIMPEITSTVIKTLPKDTKVSVIETAGNWSYITADGVYGWIRTYKKNSEAKPSEETTTTKETKEEETKTETKTETKEEQQPVSVETTTSSLKRGYINVDSANVREQPSTSAKIVTTLILNTGVEITGESGNWYKINFQDRISGYISKDLISAKQQ